jgi:hypothetical protein
MPYQLEKGPYFSVTESVFDNLDLRIQVLVGLKTPAPIFDPDALPTLESTSLNTTRGPVRTHDARMKHENAEWYGKQPVPGGGWAPQPPFDPQHPKATGYWHNWYGDAEGIVRETFTRGIEVSLGLQDSPNAADPAWIRQHMTRTWPIEIVTRCPAPWFEGWVTWRGTGADGHVTVHINTPSHQHSNLLKSPVRAPGYHTLEYADEEGINPALNPVGERGMWVISHKTHELVRQPYPGPLTTQNSPTGAAWTVPWFGGMVWSHDKIVAVQPSEPNGGVLAAGRPYTP